MRAILSILTAAALALGAAPTLATVYGIPRGDGTFAYVDDHDPVTISIGSLSFPPPWLLTSTPQMRSARGIVAVVETPPPDPAANAVSGSSIQLVAGVPTRVWASTSYTQQQVAANSYAALVASGAVAVVSTGTPSLSGTYGITLNDKINMAAVTAGIAASQGLPGSGDSFTYFDTSHAGHSFTSAQWLVFAKAMRDYVYSFALAASGQGAVPSTPITIP